MKTPKMYKTIVYFDKLSKEAKEEARKWWEEGNDYPFLKESIKEYTTHKLETAGYGVVEIEVYYSLSCCQGDGVYFTGKITKGDKEYTLSQRGMGYSLYITTENSDGEEIDAPDEMVLEMDSIANEAKRYGYDFIDGEDSDECVDENIRCNEYTFSLSGERMDPD